MSSSYDDFDRNQLINSRCIKLTKSQFKQQKKYIINRYTKIAKQIAEQMRGETK